MAMVVMVVVIVVVVVVVVVAVVVVAVVVAVIVFSELKKLVKFIFQTVTNLASHVSSLGM
jgi:hypothetical protein